MGSGLKTKIGSVVYVFPVLDSTNTRTAKLLTESTPAHGTVVSAGHQTAGRGQIGRSWHSVPNQSLCLSVILYPEIRAQDQFLLNISVALAVMTTVRQFCQNLAVRVKWPNDIFVGNQKVAGILIQNSIQGNRLAVCIAGIGINVNETSFPQGLPNPVSLRQLHDAANPLDLRLVRDTLYATLESRLSQLTSEDYASLRADYMACLYRRNVPASFIRTATGEAFEGTITHVDDTGRLVISDSEGRSEVFQFREVAFLIPDS